MSDHRIPSVNGGLPWLGHALEFRRNPVAFLRRGRESCGELFSFLLVGKTVHVLTEPSGNEAFFRAPDDQLSAKDAYRFTVPMFGRAVAYDVTPELLDEQLALVLPALLHERIKTYVLAMDSEFL